MESKFHLKKDENIELAKQMMDDLLYASMKIEGSELSCQEIKKLIVEAKQERKPDIISNENEIVNLKKAWSYMLETIDEPFNFDLINKINQLVAPISKFKRDSLWSGRLSAEGWLMNYTTREITNVFQDMTDINQTSETSVDQALQLFSYLYTCELFWAGHRKTSLIIANRILIENGNGLLVITESQLHEFFELLDHHMLTKENNDLIPFLYDQCLLGVN